MRRLGLLLAAAGALMLLACWALVARDATRRERDLVAGSAQPAILRVSGGKALIARTTVDAPAVLAAIVADRGSAAGVRLSVRPLAGAVPPGFAAADVDARGPERALRALARSVEGQRPIVRFVQWSIAPSADGSLRLQARAVAPVAIRP